MACKGETNPPNSVMKDHMWEGEKLTIGACALAKVTVGACTKLSGKGLHVEEHSLMVVECSLSGLYTC